MQVFFVTQSSLTIWNTDICVQESFKLTFCCLEVFFGAILIQTETCVVHFMRQKNYFYEVNIVLLCRQRYGSALLFETDTSLQSLRQVMELLECLHR